MRARPTTRLAVAVSLSCLAVAVAAVPAGAQAARERRIGLITHLMDARTVTLMRDLGVRHVKTTLYWARWVEQPDYPKDFAAGIARLRAAGFELTVVVHAPPTRAGYATYDNRARVYRDFAAFMGARAAQFPGVRNWQLWNEMDGGWTPIFGHGAAGVSPFEQGRNYAAMLNLAHPAIKRRNPRARVVVGGLGGPDYAEFVRGIYAGRGRFDVMAVHAYGPPVWLAARVRGSDVRKVMRANGDERPMWLTEFGIDSASMMRAWGIADPARWDREQQAQWSETAAGNDSTGIYERLIGYVLYDESSYGFGIVRSDASTTRPVYGWLRARNR